MGFIKFSVSAEDVTLGEKLDRLGGGSIMLRKVQPSLG